MGRTMGNGRYIKDVALGKGTFGAVYKAKDTQTGEWVAIKQIFLGESGRAGGVNVTALREVKLLKELHHENVIQLVHVFAHKGDLNLVFELMDTDLEAIINDPGTVLSPGDIKAYMQMTLRALAFCHAKWVLHRDVKPNNLMLSSTGALKLGDFGLAKIYGSPHPRLTNEVFALWYRAPELLFGSRAYTSAVDMWGAGCVFAELLLRTIFLRGASTLDQLGKIFEVFGTPQDSSWPGVTCLPDYVQFQPCPPRPLRDSFPGASEDALDLLARMFALDPNRRITAQQALEHRYFTSAPPPTDPRNLPRPLKQRGQARGMVRPLGRPVLSPSSDEEDEGQGHGQGHNAVRKDAPQSGSSAGKPLKRKLDDMFGGAVNE